MAKASPVTDESSTEKAAPKKGAIREYTEAIVIALAIALFLRYFVVEAFKIPSASMVPTLLVGDHIFVNKFIYGIRVPFTNKKLFTYRTPARGDIIVFIYPLDRSKDYIKRVVGIPGDKIEVKEGLLYVNDKPVSKTFLENYEYTDINQACALSQYEKFEEVLDGRNNAEVHFATLSDKSRLPSNYGPQWVEEGKLFAMGDNRDNSSDSRVWGMVPMENVKGKALFIWLSINRCGLQSDSIAGGVSNAVAFHWLRFHRFFQGLH